MAVKHKIKNKILQEHGQARTQRGVRAFWGKLYHNHVQIFIRNLVYTPNFGLKNGIKLKTKYFKNMDRPVHRGECEPFGVNYITIMCRFSLETWFTPLILVLKMAFSWDLHPPAPSPLQNTWNTPSSKVCVSAWQKAQRLLSHSGRWGCWCSVILIIKIEETNHRKPHGKATATLSYDNGRNQTWATAEASKGFSPAPFRAGLFQSLGLQSSDSGTVVRALAMQSWDSWFTVRLLKSF